MNGLALEYEPAGHRTAIRPERMLFHVLLLLRGEAVARDMMVGAVLGEPDGSPIRAAKACRRLGERVEHRLQIKGRAADDLEHVGGGSLLLQRVGQLARACTSSYSRTFSIAIRAWSAKVLTSSICLSVNGRTS